MGRVADLDEEDTGRYAIGGNSPPEPIDPFVAHETNISDLFLEAKNWLDGSDIETEAQASAVQELLRKMQEAHNAADASRVEEKDPWDKKAAEVQEKYAPLIADTKKVKGKTTLAIPALREAIRKWLVKLDEDREAEATRQRDIANKAVADAAALIQEAKQTGDLEAIEQAEDALSTAKELTQAATRVEAAKPMTGGYGRSVSLRDNWVIAGFQPLESPEGTVEGETALLRHYWSTNRQALLDAALEIARKDISEGKRTIPGLIIKNDRKAV